MESWLLTNLFILILTFSSVQCREPDIGDHTPPRDLESDNHEAGHSIEGDYDASERSGRFKRAAAGEKFERPWQDTDWHELGRKRIKEAILKTERLRNSGLAKNVILFIGDGMGLQTVAAARVFKGQKLRLKREDIYLSWERLPHTSISRTYNVDKLTPDSAGTGTAYMAGVKANLGTIGVNEKVEYGKCANLHGNRLKSIAHNSIAEGKSTGIVTTTRVTHASPAAAYASTPSRYWEADVPKTVQNGEACEDIASQLVLDDRNQDIRVVFGGGAEMFLPKGGKFRDGIREDGKNLIEEWTNRREAAGVKHKVVRNRNELKSLKASETDYALGLFAPSHMNFEMDRDNQTEPELAEMVEKAIEILSKNPKGFYLFVEGGRIDQAHHETLGHKALEDTLAMDRAFEKTLQLVDLNETLVVVSADHSHTFSVSGYGDFQNSILGYADTSLSDILDGKPALQMGYVNGPGAKYHRFKQVNNDLKEFPRLDLSTLPADEIYHKDFMQDAGVWTTIEHHGGDDVGVYAAGPWSHLFQSTEEQSYLAQVMMYASCVGLYTKETHCPSSSLHLRPSIPLSVLFPLLLSLFLSVAFTKGSRL